MLTEMHLVQWVTLRAMCFIAFLQEKYMQQFPSLSHTSAADYVRLAWYVSPKLCSTWQVTFYNISRLDYNNSTEELARFLIVVADLVLLHGIINFQPCNQVLRSRFWLVALDKNLEQKICMVLRMYYGNAVHTQDKCFTDLLKTVGSVHNKMQCVERLAKISIAQNVTENKNRKKSC